MKERFNVLDVFRGIFSSMVVLFHLSTFSNTPVLNNKLIYNSDLFVDFFFVLSGFVITYSYKHMSDSHQLSRFLKKRLYRLYPLHVMMLFAFVAVEASKHFLSPYIHVNEPNNTDNNITTFFSSLFLVNSVKLPGVKDVSWNVPSWSISGEMIAYLTFGLITVLIHKAKWFKQRSLVYTVCLGIVAGIFYLITGWDQLTYSFDYGFLRAIMGFITGVLCFHAYSYSKAYLRSLPAGIFHIAETCILLLILLLVWHKDRFKQSEYIYELLFFCSIFIFAFEKGYISHTLQRIPLLEKIGRYSYSIYMTHALLLSLFNILFIRILKFPPSAYAYLFIFNCAIIYFVSKWTYDNIEMRFTIKAKKPVTAATQPLVEV